MATLNDVLDGMKLLSRYENGDSSVNAGHDRLYVGGPHPSELPDGEVEELSKLGWIWDDEFDCWLQFT